MTKPLVEFDTDLSEEFLSEFGSRLRTARQQLKVLQKDFAKKIEVSSSFLSELEKGKNKPGLFVLKRLTLIYNISLDYLINGKGKPFLDEKGHSPAILPGDDLLAECDKTRIMELNRYMMYSPYVRYEILKHFIDFVHRERATIEDDMERSRQHL
ncbi:MAG: helix-turn-helix domain-containing protein [Candidatus Omnitrophota bacterium]